MPSPLPAAVLALALAPAQPHPDPAKGHVVVTPDDIKWRDGPASLPAGAKMAVLDGDPRRTSV